MDTVDNHAEQKNPWEKEHSIHFHIYKVLGNANYSCNNKKQTKSCLALRKEKITRELKETLGCDMFVTFIAVVISVGTHYF